MDSNDYDPKRMPSPPKTLPDASSAAFMAYLGLDTRLDKDAQVYDQMKADALRAHRRICSDRRNLLPYLQQDPSIRYPFTVTQITEQALRDEALRMHAEARGRVREIYDSAAAMEDGSGGSWAARWMLWHIFLRGGREESPSEECSAGRNWFLDPLLLRDQMNGKYGRRRHGSEARSVGSSPGENRGYWDPVRHA